MKVLFKLILLVLILTINGCGSQLPAKTYYLAEREAAKNRAEYQQLQKLCNANDRRIINKTEKVKGYAIFKRATCHRYWDILFEHDYEYYECEKLKDSQSGIDKQKGLYEYSLGNEGENGCIEFSSFLRSTEEKYRSRMINQCLLSEKKDTLRSSYGVKFKKGYVNKMQHIYKGSDFPNKSERNIKNLIVFSEAIVIDLTDSSILAKTTNYKYWPESMSQELIGFYECDEYMTLPVHEVLIPDATN